MNKENCALKVVDEIILYYDARSKKHQNTHFMNNDNVEKYCTAGQSTDDNMAHAYCMVDN